MAIIVCKECDHRVSDQAASCPGCGAPMAAAGDAFHQGQRRVLIAVIGAAAVALIGAAYWFDGRRPSSQSGAHGETFSRADRLSSAESRDDLKATPRTVYQTTADRLYQDYAANGVAMQTKIAGSLIRISGRISEIDEDASGNPLVKLAAGNDNSINMTLGSDEVAAAAQLSRGQTVDIQCDRMRRVQGSLEGSRCNLVLVQQAASTPAPAIRAPLPASRGSPESPAKSRRPSLPSMIAMVPAVASQPESLTSAQSTTATPLGPAEITTVSPIAPTPSGPANSPVREASAQPLRLTPIADASSDPEPSAANVSGALTPTAAVTSTPAVTSTAAIAPATAVAPADAVAPAAAVASTPATPSTAAATPALTAPSAAVASDDLAAVRAADPQAADHIASYCASTSGTGGGVATCRRDEREAWTRLVQRNEFPALDNATRLKCSQPPFPDSYRAKEICAKYELRIY